MQKSVLILAFLLGLLNSNTAQRALEPVMADVLSSPKVQKIFEGRSAYVIMANEVINPENCNLSYIRIDRPVRYWRDGQLAEDGMYDIEARNCILVMSVTFDPRNGYRVLMKDLNTGMNVFLSKAAF